MQRSTQRGNFYQMQTRRYVLRRPRATPAPRKKAPPPHAAHATALWKAIVAVPCPMPASLNSHRYTSLSPAAKRKKAFRVYRRHEVLIFFAASRYEVVERQRRGAAASVECRPPNSAYASSFRAAMLHALPPTYSRSPAPPSVPPSPPHACRQFSAVFRLPAEKGVKASAGESSSAPSHARRPRSGNKAGPGQPEAERAARSRAGVMCSRRQQTATPTGCPRGSEHGPCAITRRRTPRFCPPRHSIRSVSTPSAVSSDKAPRQPYAPHVYPSREKGTDAQHSSGAGNAARSAAPAKIYRAGRCRHARQEVVVVMKWTGLQGKHTCRRAFRECQVIMEEYVKSQSVYRQELGRCYGHGSGASSRLPRCMLTPCNMFRSPVNACYAQPLFFKFSSLQASPQRVV